MAEQPAATLQGRFGHWSPSSTLNLELLASKVFVQNEHRACFMRIEMTIYTEGNTLRLCQNSPSNID
jgi:hypothetical protein